MELLNRLNRFFSTLIFLAYAQVARVLYIKVPQAGPKLDYTRRARVGPAFGPSFFNDNSCGTGLSLIVVFDLITYAT